ncbi:Flagellar protein FliS [Fundidesulfovibrio magnetotacticus]|uniref:Flagellar protein FliS n=1 Tax=Fundidesulfovibrio magnetotacticus TaxID=2730080 RepID=A0A6V8LZR5_9BACT|nr:flagellar export chaperone FliS [Fundidesulfovibrio magnetotacticus]GFK95708.1 Flagellar protein FliS [Fundidesulfovibrio magnetotacticus]
MYKAAQAYFQTQVTTTTQGDLLIMLFDGALKFLRQAKERMDAKDYAKKGILISKALDVLAELQGSLNAQKGGELAENLRKLYLLCSTKLLMANMRMDQKLVDEVIGVLTGIRDAFAQINTPEFAPKAPSPAQTSRGPVPLTNQTAVAAPSLGASMNKAFSAYSQAKKAG